MRNPSIKLSGTDYVNLERAEYDRLTTLAKAADLPPLPKADSEGEGNYPALEYSRTSIARDIIRDRVAAGLSQQELAVLAGIRLKPFAASKPASIRRPCRQLRRSTAL